MRWWDAMRWAWTVAKGGAAVLALVAALSAAPAVPAAAQAEGRPAVDAPSRKVIRTKRLRMPADLFERDAVFFKRARLDPGGTIRADGHNLDLYGMELVRRNRICAPEGARWACGQRAFIAMRGLLEGKSISCSFLASAGSPKAVCRVGDTDVTQWLLSQGWAELAEGVTDESYIEAAASARRSKAGIWGFVRTRGRTRRTGVGTAISGDNGKRLWRRAYSNRRPVYDAGHLAAPTYPAP